jgi:chloramphenicol-sensitive protein RarD
VSDTTQRVGAGFAASIGAHLVWGTLPVYLRLFPETPAGFLVAHRVIWCLPFAFLATWAMGQRHAALAILRDPKRWPLFLCTAALIASNWVFYYIAIQQNRIMETSLGYFLLPLTTVAMGMIFLGERISKLQAAGVFFAAAGVIVMSLGVDGVPWLGLILGTSFAFYGLIRKQAPVAAAPGLLVESVFLLPIALFFLLQPSAQGFADAGSDPAKWAFFVGVGALTATALILFTFSAQRLKLSTLGFLQFVSPTISFLLAIHYGEPFGPQKLTAFLLIWTGVGLYLVHMFRTLRAARVPAAS